MSVHTFEAITDDQGNVRFAGAVRLPAHTKVYVIVPEQITSYTEIVPEPLELRPSEMRFPLIRIMDEGLTKRLVKTIIEDDRAEV